MAKCSCKVRFGPFRANMSGYSATMNAYAVQSILLDHAERTKRAADGALSADNYDTAEAHKVGVAHGKLSNGCYVRTNTNHAKRSTLRHNTLKKALQ